MAYDDPYAENPYETPYPNTAGLSNIQTPYPNTAGLSNIQMGGTPITLPAGDTLPDQIAAYQKGRQGQSATSGSGNSALWAQSGQNPQAFIQALIARDGLKGAQTDPTALNKILAALKEVGVNASLDTRTDAFHKGIMLNGQFVKMLDGNDNWIYQTGADSGGAGGTVANIDPSYLTPFSKPYTLPGDATLPQYGGAPAFNYQDFTPTTGADVLSDPSYQFRADQGRKQVETSASARGLLNSGGTLADILGFGQQMASQEFGNVDARRQENYSTNRANAADIYAKNYNTQFTDPYTFNTTRANTSADRARQSWLDEQDAYYRGQNEPFKKLYDLSSLGLNAASQ